MKDIKTLTQLRAFIKTEEAFTDEFKYKGFSIWWNDYDAKGIQTPMDGYFRCDPSTNTQYNNFHKLQEKMIGGFEWYLS